MNIDLTPMSTVDHANDKYEEIVDFVDKLIRSEVYSLLKGQSRYVAQKIIAELADKFNMVPGDK